MSTHRHTDISAGAAATAATINAPLGQLDAALNPSVLEYAAGSNAATSCATAGTYYACTGPVEVSFTPAYTGQVFEILLTIGRTYASGAGVTTLNLRITDGSNATILDAFGMSASHAVSSDYDGTVIARYWTAGAGDVGVTRKAKLYASHSANTTTINLAYLTLDVVSHG